MSSASTAPKPAALPPLLGPGDPPPVTVLNREGRAPVLLLCDHASNAVPASLGTLGLDDEAMSRHIAWDIGAADVTRALVERYDAAAVLSGYSRLIVDINRDLEDPTSIPVISDGTIVPANRTLDPAEAALRIDELFWPYQTTVAAEIDRMMGRGRSRPSCRFTASRLLCTASTGPGISASCGTRTRGWRGRSSRVYSATQALCWG